jgi:hypothetical protein
MPPAQLVRKGENRSQCGPLFLSAKGSILASAEVVRDSSARSRVETDFKETKFIMTDY